jgi:CRP/FNR family transcriptional regulator, anaerobic regulatory protein
MAANSGSFGRFGEFLSLGDEEHAALAAVLGPVQHVRRLDVIRRDGVEPSHVHLLVDGWAAVSMALRSGREQIVKVHLPGDLLGTPSICLTTSRESVWALTAAAVRSVSRKDLMAVMMRHPRIGATMFLSVQKERVALMDSLLLMGQADARTRIAGMLVSLLDRLAALDLVEDDGFDLPLTQIQIADVVGLSPVHVNRTFKQMEREGLLTRANQRIILRDVRHLRQIAGLTPARFERDPGWISNGL